MVARTPSVEEQRDNLQIGIYLAANPYGVRIERVIEVALGYDVGAPAYPYESYERRFRRAQAIGRDKLKARSPGYFTFNAVPFGRIFLYKALWYAWINPQTGEAQTVPLLAGDLAPMQRARDKDLLRGGIPLGPSGLPQTSKSNAKRSKEATTERSRQSMTAWPRMSPSERS